MNVCIESYWRQHRQRSADYWIDVFSSFSMENVYTGDIVDKWCLWYVYLPLIEADLKLAMEYHNEHRIRSQPGRVRPHGKPNFIYDHPELYGAAKCGIRISAQQLQELLVEANIDSLDVPDFLPAAIRRIINEWMRFNQIPQINPDNAKQIYLQLRDYINRNIQ